MQPPLFVQAHCCSTSSVLTHRLAWPPTSSSLHITDHSVRYTYATACLGNLRWWNLASAAKCRPLWYQYHTTPYISTMHQTQGQSNLFHRQPLAITGNGFSQIRCFSCCPTSSVMYIAKSLPRQTHSTDRTVTTSTHPTLTQTRTDYRCTDYRLIIGISRCR